MRAAVLIISLLWLSGCVTPVIDYHAGTDFSRYHLVQFSADPSRPESLDDKRLREALAQVLPQHGLTLVERDADLKLVSRFLPYSRFDGSELFWGVGATRDNLGIAVASPVTLNETRTWRLQLELVDSASNQVVWSARSADSMDEDYLSAKRSSWISKTVVRMFEHYPPTTAH